MSDLLQIDPRIKLIFDALDPPGAIPPERPDPDTDRMEASVALIVRARDPLELLVIKRAQYEGDPWSGHMALPGGRWEPQDESLLDTAVRETREETGIDLANVGVPLGRLDDVEPATPRLPPLRISPYVFAAPADVEAAVVSHELESVHWVPVDQLLNPESNTSIRIHFSGFSKTFPSYAVGDEHVWGLTHRILSGFLDRWPRRELERTR